MSGKTSKSRLRFSHALYLVVALAGLVCIPILATDPGFAEDEKSVEVGTVTQPRVGTITVPESPGATGGQSVASEQDEVAGEAADSEGGERCGHLLLRVGSGHVLSQDYVPPELAYLTDYGIAARSSEIMLRREVAEQLGFLISAAAQEGVEVLVASGYRPYWEQAGTFAWFKETYGEEAGKLSVPPGQSEHQLGTAVDFTSSHVDYELVPAFDQTAEGAWLAENAARYGFVLSYGEDREEETGVRYEPWHYRYVGVENALEVEAAGGVTSSVYREGAPDCYGA